MSKLFVKEDEDEEMTTTSPSYQHNINTTIDEESEQQQQSEQQSEQQQDKDLDDPIIKEIPIILKPTTPTQRVLLLQYPGRPITRPFIEKNCILKAREKISTNIIEIDIPIDTTKFYDLNKNDNWGIINKQTLNGVLMNSDGYYIGNVQNGELILIPVNKSAQLRPAFNYIDKEVSDKKEVTRLENGLNNGGNSNNGGKNGNGNSGNGYNNNNGPNGVQVVQMTVKSTTDNTPRLGGALLERKKADEEEFINMNWNDLNDEKTNEIRSNFLNVENKYELISNTTNDEYINMLVEETIVE